MGHHEIDFSVIIACYNPDLEKLKKTINSVVNQKNVRFEIIVADDGSRIDYKADVIDYFKTIGFENFKLSFLQENQGTVANILAGVALSEAPYIKVISPGDYLYDENSLAEYLNAFTKKGAELVFSRAQYFTPQGELLPLGAPANTVVFRNRQIKRNIVSYHDYILGATIAVKRELFEYLTRLQGKIRYLEDVPLSFLAILNKNKVYAVNKKLVWYEYGFGISTNRSTSQLLQNDYKEFFQYLKEHYAKQSKLALKFYLIEEQQGRWKRFFKKIAASPLYGFYMLRRRLSRHKIAKNEIEGLEKITALTDRTS